MSFLYKSNRRTSRSTASLVWTGFLFLQLFFASQSLIAAEDHWQDVERIVAIGDIHGDYDNFLKLLKESNIVNRRGELDCR